MKVAICLFVDFLISRHLGPRETITIDLARDEEKMKNYYDNAELI
jgi:hypothetical protein